VHAHAGLDALFDQDCAHSLQSVSKGAAHANADRTLGRISVGISHGESGRPGAFPSLWSFSKKEPFKPSFLQFNFAAGVASSDVVKCAIIEEPEA